MNFGDEIAYQLRLARKKRWQQMEEKRMQEEIELQTYLVNLILKDKDEKLRELGEKELSEKHDQTLRNAIEEKAHKNIAEVDNMFAQLDARRKVRADVLSSPAYCNLRCTET